MIFILWGILLVSVIILFILISKTRNSALTSGYEIKESSASLWLASGLFLVSISLCVIIPFQKTPLFESKNSQMNLILLQLFLSILMIMNVLLYYNKKIYIQKNQIIIQNLWGNQTTYTLSEIKNITCSTTVIKIYLESRSLSIRKAKNELSKIETTLRANFPKKIFL